jgi:hypothetical protein
MKRIALTICSATILLYACNSETKSETTSADSTATTASAEEPKEKAWVAVDSATEMKAWMEYATPGEIHKELAKSAGTWTGESTMWMSEGAPAMKSTTTSTAKMVMDGRYQVTNFKGDMMGMSFEGMGVMGYDNYKKKIVSTWFDNMGTGFMQMEGPYDPASKKMTLTGKFTNPANGIDCEMKEVYTIIDDNNHLMEMWGPDSKTGKQYKTMEIKFTRKK